MLIGCLLDDYLMIFLLLFDDYCVYLSYLINICKNMQSEWLSQFCIRQAMLPQNTGGQPCTSSEGNLWFAWFITAKRPPRISMCIMHPTVWKELTAALEANFGEPLSKESPLHSAESVFWRKAGLVRAVSPLLRHRRQVPGGVSVARARRRRSRLRRSARTFP